MINTKEKTVLCVDDEKTALLVFELYFLDRKEYKPIMFNNAPDALEYMKDNHVDIVVTDYMMEPINGLDFAEEIRKNNKTIPIILQSGFSSEDIYKKRMEALNIGAFLAKPFSDTQFFEAIVKLT